MSDKEDNGSPEINMLDFCLIDGVPVNTTYNTTLLQDNELCSVITNLNQTFIATSVNGSVNFWNENLSLMSNHEIRSEKYQTLTKNSEDCSTSVVMSPDFAGRESPLGSCENFRRRSPENDCYSLSSGEMIMRNNSSRLEDQSLLFFSSMDESSTYSPADHPAFPAVSNSQSTVFPDVCEKSTERVIEDNTGYLCLGMTFTQTELPTGENDPSSTSFVSLPSEKEKGLLMTFICETSPADDGKEAQFASAEAELLHLPGASTPGHGNVCVFSLSPMQEADMDIQTSTPVRAIGNKIPTLPSLSESPCTGSTKIPAHHPVKRQQMSVTSKHFVSGMPSSVSRVKKLEIKKFPKTDLSSVKSIVVTRNSRQMPVPDRASQRAPSQVNVNNKNTEAHRGVFFQNSPAKVRSSTTTVPSTSKMYSDAQENTGADNYGVTVIQSSGHTDVDGHGKSRASPPHHLPVANTLASVVECSNDCSEMEQADSNQRAGAAAQHVGNQTFCLGSSLEKSPDRSGQTVPKPTPKKGGSNKIEVRSGSALGQEDKPPVRKTRPRCSSENTASSMLLKEKRSSLRVSNSFSTLKADTHQSQTKPGTLNSSSQNKQTIHAEKIGLAEGPRKSTKARTLWDACKSRFQKQTSKETIGAALSQSPADSHRAAIRSTRQKQTTPGRDECRTTKAAGTQSKQKSTTGSQRAQAIGGSTLCNKVQLNGLRPPPTPTRPSPMGLPSTTAARLQCKTPGSSRGQTQASEGAGITQISGGAAQKQTPLKAVRLKARLITTPAKNTVPAALSTPWKHSASTAVTPLKRTTPARLFRPNPVGAVDKNKAKASSRQQQQSQRQGPPDVVPASVSEDGRVHKLTGLLEDSNRAFEAIAVVLQQALAERDEAKQHCSDLSQELVHLRGELVNSVHSSEVLQKQKDDALLSAQQQHQWELTQLELRLQAFYQTEWDKVHRAYQDQADNCNSLLQQQLAELEANHKAMKLELEKSVKQQYETSVEELHKVHSEELQSLEKTLKDSEAALSGQIQALTVENQAFSEKLSAEENRRKELAEKCQEDSHTVYLEQELESLKVVLEIKNKQLHQQEKRLMEVDKLKEKNATLDESLKKVQQENEDFRARMDRHAQLSRQLSTEQAVLQESLQKESKVNKRLSMENEELMWKLHNGDLSSPRKVSPTASMSPAHSFSLQSPRSSGLFSTTPLAPR